MIELLLAVSLLTGTPQDPSPDVMTGERTVLPDRETPSRCWAVFYDSDPRLRGALVLNGEVWHDAGEFLVGAFSARTIRGLARRGIESIEIGPTDMEEDLWLISELEVTRMGGKLSPLCREILRTSEGRLLALPPGMIPRAAGTTEAHFNHVGMSLIARRAWLPTKPSSRQGEKPAGSDLAVTGHDSRVQALVDQLNKSNLEAKVVDLSAIYTRRANSSGCYQARDMIRGWFNSFGLSTRLEWFSSYYAENVIAEIPGTTHPDEIVVVGGHYDSINHAGGSRAPGADDNASGTSGVVEVARVLAGGGPYERTIRFIAFGAEELGLYGSAASAANSKALGENIVAKFVHGDSEGRHAVLEVGRVTLTLVLNEVLGDTGSRFGPPGETTIFGGKKPSADAIRLGVFQQR